MEWSRLNSKPRNQNAQQTKRVPHEKNRNLQLRPPTLSKTPNENDLERQENEPYNERTPLRHYQEPIRKAVHELDIKGV